MRFIGLRMVKKLENNKEKKYVFDYIIDDIKNNCLKNTFVYNEGGIGKTTQLKKLAQMLLSPEGRKYAPNVIPIYIAVKDLHGNKNKNTLFNTVKKFCGEDSSDKELEDLLDGSSSMRKDFIFLFIIDGLNEAKDEIKRELQREINNLMKFEQNVFIVSSRIDETNYFSGFDKKLFVKPLDNVCEIINASKTEINPKLLEILSIPLYLKYYLYTYKKDAFYFYEDKSVKKSDILNAYLNSIDKNLEKNTVSYDKHTKNFLIDFYLPALAYELEISNETTDENLSNIKKNIAAYTYYEKLLSVDEEDEIATLFMSDCFFPLKIAKEWFALNDKKGYFVHDIWREYFAASYYSKCIDNDIIDVFDNLPSKGVREFIGEITGECAFEGKNSIDTPMSPIEEFMQINHTVLNDKPEAIRNLIEIMKASRKNYITGNYKNLNLSLSNFNDCFFRNSNFENSIIVDSTFFNNGHNTEITQLLMLNDNKILVSEDLHGIIKLWDIETSEIIDEIDTNSRIVFLGHWNNETIIAICMNGKFIYYNIRTQELIEYYFEHTSINDAKMSSDCKYVVLNMISDMAVLTKKDDRYVCIKRINMKDEFVRSFSISPDSKSYIYVTKNNTMYFCSLDENENGIYLTNSFHIDRNINRIFFKDNNTLIVDFEDIGFVEFSLGKSQPYKKLNISPSHCKISYNSNTDSLALYDYNTNKLTLKTASKEITINDFINKSDYLSTLNISDDGKFILIGTGRKRMIYIYDFQKLSLPYKSFLGQSLHITCYCESDNFFYFGTFNGLVYSADKINGRIVDFYNFRFIPLVHRIAISSNEKILAFSIIDSRGYYLLVFDIESREVLNKYKFDNYINEIGFSYDCNFLAVKYDNDNLRAFNISSTSDNNENNTLSVESAFDNLDKMKYFRSYKRQIYYNGDGGFCKKIDGQIIWKNNDLVNGCLIDCNFQNAKYIGKNNSAFYKKLYLNGAIVPPKPH